MSSPFQQALEIIREKTTNDVELGTAFERLVKVFLENDDTQMGQYEKVWHYTDWARERSGYTGKDIGIDLVAKLRNGDGYCAVQCKCYHEDHTISKQDLDSFISASASSDFTRLLLVDTSAQDIGRNAQAVFDNLEKEYTRIPTHELEDSRIDWLTYVREDRVRLASKKDLHDHQKLALKAVKEGLAEADRGKLIMACGTGKTFTSLRIAEAIAGQGKLVLYMVPSLALMSQTVREWKNDAIEDFTAFSACSDIKVGKRQDSDDQTVISLHDLAFPATTEAGKLSEQIKNADRSKMTVVFSTYQSIDVISRAQTEHGLQKFDLIICDEAHRTTGATLVGDDESNFVRIHNNENVNAEKRLYMTATPRIFGDKARTKAEDENIALASMDDEKIYGKVLFHRGFGWAVEQGLLTDYKVVVLAIDEGIVSEHVQNRLAEGSELKLDDATKIVGCYKALAKVGFAAKDKNGEPVVHHPMKRALAFCQNIKLSKMLEAEFQKVVTEYISNETDDEKAEDTLAVEIQHVDGTFNAEQRTRSLNWLKSESEENICRVLTNARCLSEGVDVPSLDAIMFLHPRKSQIDVVQSVGRVMRLAENKSLGYVILPITVAPNVSPEKALNDNEKYKVVWQILNALRAHDERFDSTINRIGLGEDVSDRLEIVGVGNRDELDATTAVVQDIKPKRASAVDTDEDTADLGDEKLAEKEHEEPEQLSFVMSDLSQAIKAKIVDRCGTRDYWENWASDIAKIAETHITRITKIVLNDGTPEKAAFNEFLEAIRDDLNPEITASDAVEMLAQHLITKPVFDTLFQGNRFTAENAVSKAMEGILNKLYDHNLDKESETLDKFYESVKRRAADIMTATGRQKLLLDLYDRFFRNAFTKLTQKLGIVYTPVEVVDFIIHSVNDVLQDEFGKSLDSKNVHILDPFTGTGTFITRLIQSGFISRENLPYKYKNEIHANEIVLLAYYIAAINIEAVYQDIAKENQYQSFDGIVLTDTFQMYEQERDMVANLLPDNSSRRTNQKKRHINVILGNPPYSAGQASANDDAANASYPNLDLRVEETYAKYSSATKKTGLYDSYIRAFRWATDRITDNGIVAFVSGAGWIDRNFADGMRKVLEEEFSSIYIINLRGDIRKNMLSGGNSGEGENIFGQGSMTGISIAIMIKNSQSFKKGIYYYEVTKNQKRNEKLNILKQTKSIHGIKEAYGFLQISPDTKFNWINLGEKQFEKFCSLNDKAGLSIFRKSGPGVSTNRDAWVYNFCVEKLRTNVDILINNFNEMLSSNINKEEAFSVSSSVVNWTRSLKNDYEKKRALPKDCGEIKKSLYRPFCKHVLFLSSRLNEAKGISPSFIHFDEDRLIILNGIGGRSGFSVLMTNHVPCLDTIEKGQCFPLYVYDEAKNDVNFGLFDKGSIRDNSFTRKSAISEGAINHYKDHYINLKNVMISADDLFYYIYGLLHSPEYRERFQNNLSKELPRIPAVKRYEDFVAFSEAGRKLGELHVNYETVEQYPVSYAQGDLRLANIDNPVDFYRVTKMKFAGTRPNLNKTSVIYNHNITMTNIPLEAYDYVVNGKSALDWVMERQCVKTDKDSGIINDANDYANETMNNPAYPLELFQRVITVSLETMKIVNSLPKLDID